MQQKQSPKYYNFIQEQQEQQLHHHQSEDRLQKSHQHQIQAAHASPKPQYAVAVEPQQSPIFQYLTSPSVQPLQQQQILTEEEYLELINKTENQNIALNQKYSITQPTSNDKQQSAQPIAQHSYKKPQAKSVPQPSVRPDIHQAYRQTYANPLGDFSLEKELAKLEESNKAIFNHGINNNEDESEQPEETEARPQKNAFKPSLQLNGQEVGQRNGNDQPQYSFVPQDYNEFTPQPQKLVSHKYAQEESVHAKSIEQPEYQIQYLTPTESLNKYLPESEHRQHPVATSPKYQYYVAGKKSKPQHYTQQQQPQRSSHPSQLQQQQEYEQQQIQSQLQQQSQQSHHPQHRQSQHPVKLIQSPQLQHEQPQLQQQYIESPIAQSQLQSEYYKSYPVAVKQPIQQSKPHQTSDVPSQSSIYVSQSTGLQHQSQPQINKKETQQVRLPLPDSKRPITQAEFQALVDAGYKVQAIPVPVPVPVSSEKYAQLQLQQQQQQHVIQQQQSSQQVIQRQQYIQQPQQHHLQSLQTLHHHQQQQLQSQHHQPSQSPHRAQSSTKQYVRYQPTAAASEGILSSYIRPLIVQYSNFMGTKT